MSRPNRAKSAHKKRRTLEDELQAGKLNMVGTPDSNRYYHVVNDVKNNVQRMEQRGYRIETGSEVSMGDANPKEIGTVATATSNPSIGTKAILMSIERKFKEEDDAYRQSEVDETEESLYDNEEKKELRYGKIKRGK